MKNSVLKIMGWAGAALIIPLLGNQFVEGWNWNWNEFVFAWVFWVVMATTILFLTRQIPKYRIIVGIVVFLIFAGIWVMLATG
ncbi:hypothetical protein HZA26_01760 [Candidatus Nomurabacteria bacterium]|nr:hypothetical protein [Candidatus Nomurabacteria bacterium]